LICYPHEAKIEKVFMIAIIIRYLTIQMTILYLASRFPFPLEKGDKLRAYHQIRELSKQHQIILACTSDVAVSDADLNELKPYCKKILIHFLGKKEIGLNLLKGVFNSKPFQVNYFFNYAFANKLITICSEQQVEMIFCQLLRMAPYAALLPVKRKTIDYMDAFGKGYERMANAANVFKGMIYHIEKRRLIKYEDRIFNQFNFHSIISEQDRKVLHVKEKEKVSVIANGVDLEYYSPKSTVTKSYLLFSGNMAYPPNIEAVSFIVKKVLPLVWKIMPSLKFYIVGATPTDEVKKLAEDRVVVTGWVDDVRPYFEAASIHLAPMLISIGLQNKILQAMAMGVPNIVTSMANNAIGAQHKIHLHTANTASEFCNSILELIEQPTHAAKIAANAKQFVRTNYSWQAAVGQYNLIWND
jgi:sugar transferase (PEP-CTERM/EpsH1 system associated)